MAEWAPAQIQEWNVEAQHLMPLQPPLVPELSHMREAQLHTAEASLWSVVATVQAMERKIDLLATRLLSLEGRSGTAEKKLLDCEKTAMEFGNQLESKWAVLGTLIQEYGLLQRRLENMENLLKNRNFWVLRLPPGSKGEIPKVTVTRKRKGGHLGTAECGVLGERQGSKPEAQPRIEQGADSCIPEHQNSKEREMAADPCTESLMSTPDILTRIKQEEPFAGGGQFPEERGISTDPCGGTEALISAHDFLSWIKQEEEPCVRDHWETAERDILSGPGTAGSGMAVKAEEQRHLGEEPARPGEPLFQGEPPPSAAVEAYAGQCGPAPQSLSPARSRPEFHPLAPLHSGGQANRLERQWGSDAYRQHSPSEVSWIIVGRHTGITPHCEPLEGPAEGLPARPAQEVARRAEFADPKGDPVLLMLGCGLVDLAEKETTRREEWKILKEWQKELYWKVLKDTYNALLFAADNQVAEMCHEEYAEDVGLFTSEDITAQHGNVGEAPEHLPTSGMWQGSTVRAESLSHTEYRKRIQELARFAYSPRTVTTSKPYECGLRGERFQLKGLPQIHEQVSTKNVSVHCPECGVGFQSSSHLRMHWRVHIDMSTESRKTPSSLEPGKPVPLLGIQARGRLHLCVLCGKSFQRYFDFLQHQKGHDEAEPHPCAQCEIVFMFQSDLEIHEESHLEEVLCEHAVCGKNCICDISLQLHFACQLRKHSKSGLQSHEPLHQKACSEEKPYLCGLCKQQFKLKINLETHYMYCHKEWVLKHNFKCSAQNSLLQHKKVQANQEHTKPAPSDSSNGVQNSGPPSLPSCTLCSCSYCGKWFVSKFSLRKHQKRHKHGGAVKRDKKVGFTGGFGGSLLAHVTKKLHRCQECGMKFVYKWQLVAHLKVHAQEKQPLPLHHGNILEHGSDLDKQCQVHTKKWARKNGKHSKSASVHALTVDQRRRAEEQLCEQCGKIFKKHYMPQHLAFHAGLRYKCLLCEKILSFQSGISYHLRRHCQQGDFAPCSDGKKRGGSNYCLCMMEKIYVAPGPPLPQSAKECSALDRVPQPSEDFPAKSLGAERGQSLGSNG
ncbi:hypothetical protein lerEdw1_005988, partial [Lerista edwardsae]